MHHINYRYFNICSALLRASPPGANVALFCMAVVNMSDVSTASLRRMVVKAGGCQEASDKLSRELIRTKESFFPRQNL